MRIRLRPYLTVLILALTLFASVRARGAPELHPRKVVVGTFLNHIVSVDIKNNQFGVDFYVWFRWEGDDLKPLETFELANGRITAKSGFVKKTLGTQNYALCRVLGTINKFWDLRRFPIDNHTMTLEIEDSEQDERTVIYERDTDNTGISPSLQIPGWVVSRSAAAVVQQVYRTNYGDTSLPSNTESHYSRYIYSLDVARPGYGRFLRVFFGLFISVLISFCAFHVRPKESSPRVSLGIGATFAASAVTVAINNSLPDTNSVTLADKLIMLTLAMIVGSVVITIIALALFARGKESSQQQLDRYCAVLFPAGYLVLLAILLF